MKKVKMYKIGFWIAVAIVIILGVILVRTLTANEEGVTYVDLPEDEVEESEIIELIEETEQEIETPEEERIPEQESTLNVLIVEEGDLVSFPNLEVKDPDGDEVFITFSEPLNEDGEWQTQPGDAGTYEITITASDGIDEVSKKVLVIVESTNNPPVIEIEPLIEVDEGDVVELRPNVYDPDGDDVEITYSGWMTTDTKQTDFGDAGEHTVIIAASDGIDTTQKEVTVIVNKVNRPPVFINII